MNQIKKWAIITIVWALIALVLFSLLSGKATYILGLVGWVVVITSQLAIIQLVNNIMDKKIA